MGKPENGPSEAGNGASEAGNGPSVAENGASTMKLLVTEWFTPSIILCSQLTGVDGCTNCSGDTM